MYMEDKIKIAIMQKIMNSPIITLLPKGANSVFAEDSFNLQIDPIPAVIIHLLGEGREESNNTWIYTWGITVINKEDYNMIEKISGQIKKLLHNQPLDIPNIDTEYGCLDFRCVKTGRADYSVHNKLGFKTDIYTSLVIDFKEC